VKNKIRIVLSTAIIDDNVNISNRIKEYQECFDIIKNLGYDFSIVETVLNSSEFLERNSKEIIYTNVNGNFRNRGTNYVNAFKKFLNQSNFDADDIIIHVTGRYPLIDDNFFLNCYNLESNKIGCFKKDEHGQFYLFLYCMRFKYLKELLNTIDVDHMEKNMINLERIFADAIPSNQVKLVDHLGILGRQSNEKNPNVYGKIKF
jgi:hypothetical protein